MTEQRFQACLKIILKEEGGNDDDPRDPGGRTSRGITAAVWKAFRSKHSGRPTDVWQAKDEDVATIYREQYWQPYCDDMPAGIDLVFFNTSVNSGRSQAVKEMQRSLGTDKIDGMYGLVTKAALLAHKDVPGLIRKMCDERRKFYKALKTFKTFGKGWLARTDRVEKSALGMVGESGAASGVIAVAHPNVDTKESDPTVTVAAKAEPTDADTNVISPETSGAAAAGTATIAGAVAQIQSELSQFASTIELDFVKYILFAVSIIGIGNMIYGMVKRARVARSIS